MYIKKTERYYRGASQATKRQWFLLLVQKKNGKERGADAIRALVRKVAMEQCGHFMMGTARAFNRSIVVSGSYGGDGLPKRVPDEVWERSVPITEELYQAWSHGDGWNGAGKEATLMREWAIENFEKLAPKGATL